MMNRGNYDTYAEYVWDRIKRKVKRLSREKKIAICYGTLTLIVGLFLGVQIGGNIEKRKAEKELVEVTAQIEKEAKEGIDQLQEKLDQALEEVNKNSDTVTQPVERPWNLVLVNFENPMDENYQIPKFVELESGYSVDSRIAAAARNMLSDAEKAGMNVIICSAYRSVERQEEVFNESLQKRLNNGMSYWEAFVDNRMSVAEPGTSEHALGLALDLISNQYTGLDEKQQETKEAKWLAENCYKYGFILRYPPEKTDITGIVYEPWHYRYVGVEDAKKITELGVTLEEYLEMYY